MTTRYVTLATETVEWIAGGTKAVKYTVSLVREETDHGGDIGWRTAARGLTVLETMAVDGQREVGYLMPVVGHAVAVAKWGRIGMVAETFGRVTAAVAAVKAHPEYVAYQAAEAEGIKIMVEHEEHVAAVERMMTLGGKTY